MLIGDGERPVRSRDGRVAVVATLEVILTVYVAAEQLWTAREVDIKQCCGPSMPSGLIDGREVFAYLLADVLGRPLLAPGDLHGVAQRGANAVTKARRLTGGQKTAEAAHAACVRMAARAGADDASRAALKAYAALLEPYALGLPASTVGRRRSTGSAAGAPAVATAAEAEAPATPHPTIEQGLAQAAAATEAARTAEATALEVHRADEARVDRARQRLAAAEAACDALPPMRSDLSDHAWDAAWERRNAPVAHAEAALEAAEAEELESFCALREAAGKVITATSVQVAWAQAAVAQATDERARAAQAARAATEAAEALEGCADPCTQLLSQIDELRAERSQLWAENERLRTAKLAAAGDADEIARLRAVCSEGARAWEAEREQLQGEIDDANEWAGDVTFVFYKLADCCGARDARCGTPEEFHDWLHDISCDLEVDGHRPHPWNQRLSYRE